MLIAIEALSFVHKYIILHIRLGIRVAKNYFQFKIRKVFVMNQVMDGWTNCYNHFHT